MRAGRFILFVLAIQALCAGVFVHRLIVDLLGLPVRPISWQLYELIEIGAGVGLVLGVFLGAFALAEARRRTLHAETLLRSASGAFVEVMEERFADWGLTPAEREVALFAIKGLRTAEIARLRETSEGTVKAQTAAIFRKAGVGGRVELLSLFIDDLIAEAPGMPSQPKQKDTRTRERTAEPRHEPAD